MKDVVGLKNWGELPGEKVYEYMEAYAAKFDLNSRLRLNTRISKVSRNEDGKRWDLFIEGSDEVVTCDKLFVATGLTSNPSWPDVPHEDFTGLVMHSKEVGVNYNALTSNKVQRVTVYGGCKSSIDTINMCIAKGKHVDWIIRESGNGPGLMLEVRLLGGRLHGGHFAGRWKNIFNPSIFSVENFWYRFLHSGQSSLGTWIINRFWAKAYETPLKLGPYKHDSENTRKLIPETTRLVHPNPRTHRVH